MLTFCECLDLLQTGQAHQELFACRSLGLGAGHQLIVPEADVAHGRVVILAEAAFDVGTGQEVRQGEGD